MKLAKDPKDLSFEEASGTHLSNRLIIAAFVSHHFQDEHHSGALSK